LSISQESTLSASTQLIQPLFLPQGTWKRLAELDLVPEFEFAADSALAGATQP
jgi:hypothetical protein